jgi:hypothetical protein
MLKNKRNQIHNSFSNPIGYLLAIIIFRMAAEYIDLGVAWLLSALIGVSVLVYIYFNFNKLFNWYLIAAGIFLFVAAFATCCYVFTFSYFPVILYDCVMLFVFIVFLLIRKKFTNFVTSRKKELMPVLNGLNELYRLIWVLVPIITTYLCFVFFNLIFKINTLENANLYIRN